MQRDKLFSEVSQALREEIELLSSEKSLQVAVYDGVFQRESGGKFEYYFRLDRIIEFPDDTPISIKRGDNSTHGSILSIEGMDVFVALDDHLGDTVPQAILESAPYFLLELALKKLEELPNSQLANRLFGVEPAAAPQQRPFSSRRNHGGFGPNAEQAEAVALALGSEISYIWGPPGTGKTTTIGWVIEALRASGLRCLILANTNVATDKAMLDTAELLQGDADVREGRFVRWGPVREQHEMAEFVDAQEIAKARSVSLRKEIEQADRQISSLTQRLETLRPFGPIADRIEEIGQRLAGLSEAKSRLEVKERSARADSAMLQDKLNLLRDQAAEAARMNAISRLLQGGKAKNLAEQMALTENRIKTASQETGALRVSIEDLRSEAEALDKEVGGLKAKHRIADPSRVRADLSAMESDIATAVTLKAALEARLKELARTVLNEAVVVATTLARCYSSEEVWRQRFDVLLVDEASMAPLPMLLVDAHLATKKVIVVGDFRQLSPIAKGTSPAINKWLRTSIFQLSGIEKAVNSGKNPPVLAQLRSQHRMHPAISRIANAFIYDGRLRDGPGVENQGQGWSQHEPAPGSPVTIFDSTALNPWCARTPRWSRFNIFSALMAAKLVSLAKDKGGLGNKDIGVIAPYSAQAQLISKLIEDTYGQGWEPLRGLGVSTVHRFQGHERKLIIFDITDGPPLRPGKLLDDGAEGGDDENLINVALTRAQGKLIFLSNASYVRELHGKTSLLSRVQEHIERDGMVIPVDGLFPDCATYYTINSPNVRSEIVSDLRAAKEDVVLVVPGASQNNPEGVAVLQALLAKGVSVTVLTHKPTALTTLGDKAKVSRFATRDKGNRVSDYEWITIVDKRIVWVGASPLGSFSDCASLRILAPRTAEELLRIYGVSRPPKGTELPKANERLREKCPECGESASIRLARKTGRYFVGCTGYPDCKWTRFLVEGDILETSDAPECPQEHGSMELKRSFRNHSFFWSCPRFKTEGCRESRSIFS